MLENREGQMVPQVTFRTRQDHEWVDVTTDEVFKGRTVIVFALPGAFTPTCSSSHVPRYNQLQPLFKANGVDEIICVSVNDAFVMFQWGKSVGNKNIFLLPDGNGEFRKEPFQLYRDTAEAEVAMKWTRRVDGLLVADYGYGAASPQLLGHGGQGERADRGWHAVQGGCQRFPSHQGR